VKQSTHWGNDALKVSVQLHLMTSTKVCGAKMIKAGLAKTAHELEQLCKLGQSFWQMVQDGGDSGK